MTTTLGAATTHALQQLADAVDRLTALLGAPELCGEPPTRWYQFAEHSEWPVIIVKAARIVSGLHAAWLLTDAGFAAEAAVILRTVDEFLEQIGCLLEAQTRDAPTAYQHRLVGEFFAGSEAVPETLIGAARRAKRLEMQAAVARLISPDDPSTTQQRSAGIAGVLHRYVHGDYLPSMELWRSGHGFVLHGAPGTLYVVAAKRRVAEYTYLALCVVAGVAAHAADGDLLDQLRAEARAYKASADYARRSTGTPPPGGTRPVR